MTPRLLGLVSFYDEPADTLSECIAALAAHGVDHLVAVDGAYQSYPDAKPASPVDQHAAIMVSCRKAGIGLSFHIPARAWDGNEVEKRTFMFAAALGVAEPGDWFWVQDADQVVITAPDLKQRLAETDHDVAALTLHDTVAARMDRKDWPPDFLLRCLFRAQPITVRRNHYTYVTADGRVLWGGQDSTHELEPALEMPDVLVEHRPDRRPRERLHAKHVYYTQRDASGAELGDCMRCDEPKAQAVRKVAFNVQPVDIRGKRVVAGTWIECCEKHARRTEYENRHQLERLGLNPDSGEFQNRNGQLPAPVAV
jgi:hypothetical protein